MIGCTGPEGVGCGAREGGATHGAARLALVGVTVRVGGRVRVRVRVRVRARVRSA